MISLQGPQTDVLVPKTEHEPGRVGSSLSLPPSQRSESASYDYDFQGGDHHPDDIVEHLDVIDPQISTVAMLTNAANAIVIPPLEWYSRKPVVVLPRRRRRKQATKDGSSAAEKGEAGQNENAEDDEDNLDLHVEDVLRKRDRARRVGRGVWSFVKTPLGVITAIYGFLVVFWGTALVFFLARFINVHNDNTQDFWVEVCQQIETGLFSLTSIGLAPFRIVDTYRRVGKIWWYKRKTEKLRYAAGLPELYDPNDLPDPQYDANFVPVLTEEEQIDCIIVSQHMFMQSQTWYRPHGTQTHRAFPVDTAVWITGMNDLNSFFQILLSGCMWGLNRFQRPAWTTATTLPLAFIAGIVAGVLIWWGSKKTKRVREVTDRLTMILALEPSAASAASTTGPSAVVLSEKATPSQRPEPGTQVAGDGSRVAPAHAASREPDTKPQRKDYADATVGSVENTRR
ncbi:uncharacterized protein B0H18DRAFT_866440 [Fomitopsis serialis]|uniref:uncharacterized protein n=1 Tax=Fomitopsis serialis TaxID=139415 RepID=UPI00200819C1|nr:uncharacterized protein B0H18DRAFT_866440 [Neoantrodia serialis]KAH9938207.1 hypothetical protein B0H18DRAFT_866440 [Neoantrodia serialis]